jgi:hypothetical protein
MSLFTSKGVSDPLVQASSNILNSTPKYVPGDNVIVKEGPNAGMDGTVVGSKSAGYTDIQLTRGRQITISDDSIAGPSGRGMLNEANDEEEAEKKPLDFKGKKKKKSKKDFFKKKDDDDEEDEEEDDKDEKDDDGPEEEDDGLPKKAKKKSKAGGNGEEIEINPKLGEQIQDLNRKANIIQSGRAMSIMRGFLSNR